MGRLLFELEDQVDRQGRPGEGEEAAVRAIRAGEHLEFVRSGAGAQGQGEDSG